MRAQIAPQVSSCSPTLAGDRGGIELKAMADESVAEPTSDFCLQTLDLIAAEFHHLAGSHVDEMVMVALGGQLISHSAVAKRVALNNAQALEQLHRPIYGGERHAWKTLRYAPVQLADVGMIDGFQERLRDAPAGAGQRDPLCAAPLLDEGRELAGAGDVADLSGFCPRRAQIFTSMPVTYMTATPMMKPPSVLGESHPVPDWDRSVFRIR